MTPESDPLEGTYVAARNSYDPDCDLCLYDLHQCRICNDVVSHDHYADHEHDNEGI